MYEAHVNLIRHGRLVCHAQRPECERCPLRDSLPLRRPEGALSERAADGWPSRSGCGRAYTRPMLSDDPGGHGAISPRILLVDDDPNLLVLLADQLRADGFEIQTARDGDEALRRLATGWPDLLIIDMMMPRMDGLTLAREIKGRADLPIIVLSAIDAGDSKADLLEEVAEDYVTKPYHYPELRARINRVLRRLGDKVPRQSLVLGPEPDPRPPPPRGDRRRRGRPADPDRVAAALRARREPRQDRHDRDAAGPRLGRDRGRRPVLRLGHDAPAAARRSSSTRTSPVHLQTVRGVGYRLVAIEPTGPGGPADDARRRPTGRPTGRRRRPSPTPTPDPDRAPASPPTRTLGR